MDTREIFYILLQGFAAGAGPYFLMCAAVVIPFVAATQRNSQAGLRSILTFSFTRLFIYVLLGASSGYVGFLLAKLFSETPFLNWVWTAGAVFIFALGLLISFGLTAGSKRDPTAIMIMLGLLIGFSPSTNFVGIMAELAIFQKNVFVGALYGFAFGAGGVVSPLLLGALAPVLRERLIRGEKSAKIFNAICGLMMAAVGVYILVSRL